jgi:hypothetical protein
VTNNGKGFTFFYFRVKHNKFGVKMAMKPG